MGLDRAMGEASRYERRGSTLAYHPLKELFLARAREFFREPEAIFWVYVFPVLLAVGLGIAFRAQPEEPARVCLVEGSDSGAPAEAGAARLREILEADPGLRLTVKPAEEARRDLLRGRTDLVLFPGKEMELSYDPQRPQGSLARLRVELALLRSQGAALPAPAADRPLKEPGSRYIDFLIPGLICMNIMGGGLWGVGFVIVDLRVRKLLKRFLATPMRKRDFLLSIVGSRMLFLVPEVAILLLVGALGFGVPLRGGFAAVAVIALLTSLSFSGMGLLVASRAARIETISGLMNAVMLPMWILSGIFFSAERFPGWLQPLIQALPLTSAIDALRAVMLEGRGLGSQGLELVNLAAWGAVSFALSLRWFRWV